MGRQTLKLASQRLVGWRDGTNVRRTWQGLTVDIMSSAPWLSKLIWLEEVEVEPNGVFNDNATSDNLLSGIYTTYTPDLSRFPTLRALQVEPYYLYSKRNQRNTIEGCADQRRHTLGVRLEGETQRWYWDWEAAYQFGEHGENDIQAWTVAMNTDYRFGGQYSPELMFSMNIASGDSQIEDGKLQTFDALFPRGSYFSEAAQLGPANFYNFHPYFIFYPTDNLRAFVGVNFYYRLQDNDGIYGPPGNIIAVGDGDSGDLVNIALSSGIEWRISERFDMSLLTTFSNPQTVLERTGNGDNIHFVELTFNWALL